MLKQLQMKAEKKTVYTEPETSLNQTSFVISYWFNGLQTLYLHEPLYTLL